MKMFLNLNDIFSYYFVIGGLFISYLVYRIFHSVLSDNNFIHIKSKNRGHSWRSIQCNKSIPYNIYCTVCGKLMLPLVGLFCECCAISACKTCHHVLNKKFRCKPTTWPSDKPFRHNWVDGISATMRKKSVYVSAEEIFLLKPLLRRGDRFLSHEFIFGSTQSENALHSGEPVKRLYCCWCQRQTLSSDIASNDLECDFQKYRKLIIPPTCVQMERGSILSIKPLQEDDWEPLIIFANRKSGSNRSDEVLSLFKGLLNPIQVADMGETPPESVVRWLPPRCRVLAAGGDGTVSWLLNALNAAPHLKAPVGILPMGTGNDLSRVLGWGPTCNSHLDAHSIISNLRMAEEQPLDRWKITIKPRRGRLRRAPAERVLHAHNYASIGVDAQVALDFHNARAQFLYRYANRTLNYIAYVFLGASRALDDGGCTGLERRLRVRADGATPLSLPPLQALVVLNIPSWGAGVDLWNLGSEDDVPEQYIDDGKLEIVGISSSFHIARLQCGLAEPYRFTQASRVKIDLEGSCAMQVDGEPWMQGAATILIEPAGQSLMLRAPDVPNSGD